MLQLLLMTPNLNDMYMQGLTLAQKSEVSKMIDDKLNTFTVNLEKKLDQKLDKIIEMTSRTPEEVKEDVQEAVDKYKFKHNKHLAFWVGFACYIGSLMGYKTHIYAWQLIKLMFTFIGIS